MSLTLENAAAEPTQPGQPSAEPAVEVRAVYLTLEKDTASVPALRGADLIVPHGGFVAVMVPTLLNWPMVSTLMRFTPMPAPTKGTKR